MKFPIMNKQPLRALTVPSFAGGMNLRDAKSRVQDNQLTDGKNVWFEGRMLETRPCVKVRDEVTGELPFMPAEAEFPHVTARREDVTYAMDGNLYRLFSYRLTYKILAGGREEERNRLYFRFICKERQMDLPLIPLYLENVNYFTVQHQNNLYCFISGGTTVHRIYVFDLNRLATPQSPEFVWRMLDNTEIYAPTVAVHCVSDLNGGVESVGAEGMNLLTNRYKTVYSTVNRSLLSAENPTHPMKYYLIHSHRAQDGTVYGSITAEVHHPNGLTVTHTASKSAGDMHYRETDAHGTVVYGSDSLTLWSDGYQLIFYTRESGGNTPAQVSESDYSEDNMTLTVDIVNTAEITDYEREREKIFGTKCSAWFGGSALGINGGSWLFLGGGSGEEQNKIYYSAAGNPLYFSENAYIGVGRSSQAVTGFGKQDDSLIVFKEREIFRVIYGGINDLSGDDLIDQTLVDMTANEIKIGLQQIHGYIGCDVPNSIELCRNRLVFLCDGTVYTLVSQSPYSERTVFSVSDLMGKRLKAEKPSALKNAFSADWNGRYLLFVGTHIYVMDYESAGYQHVSSYSKEEDGKRLIPWFYWELFNPMSTDDFSGFPLAALSEGERLHLFYIDHIHFGGGDAADFYYADVRYMDGSMGDDEGIKAERTSPIEAEITGKESLPIQTAFATKIFDFGTPQYRKNVSLLNIGIGFWRDRPLTVSFLTDQTHIREEISLRSDAAEDGRKTLRNYMVHPTVRAVDRFGLFVETESPVSVDAISLQFRLLGGAK